MRLTRPSLTLILACVLGLPLVNGCSLIGLGIGIGLDNGREPEAATDLLLSDLHAGQLVQVRLRDGSRLEGRSLGTTPVPEAAWAARYDSVRARAVDVGPLPAFGDSVILVRRDGWWIRGRFEGMALEGVLLRARGGRRSDWLSFDELDGMKTSGGDFTADQLRRACATRALPSRYRLRLATQADTLELEGDQLASVGRNKPRGMAGSVLLCAAGLVLDVMFWGWVIAGLEAFGA
jgi:hypothetical protein